MFPYFYWFMSPIIYAPMLKTKINEINDNSDDDDDNKRRTLGKVLTRGYL